MNHKVLVVLLVFVLLVSGIATGPLKAQAVNLDVSTWTQFVTAFDSLKSSGGRITLLADITAPPGGQKTFAAASEGVSVEILTEGHVFAVTGSRITFGLGVTFRSETGGPILRVGPGGVYNGTLVLQQVFVIRASAHLSGAVEVMEGGRLEMDRAGLYAGGVGIQVHDGGNAVITGGRMEVDGNGALGIRVAEGGTLHIDSSSFEMYVAGVLSNGIRVHGDAVLSGSPVITGMGETSKAVVVDGIGSLLMEGGNLVSGDIALLQLGGTAEILAGNVYGMSYGIHSRGSTQIKGGKIFGNIAAIHLKGDLTACQAELEGTNTAMVMGVDAHATLYSGIMHVTSAGSPVVTFESGTDPTLIYYTALQWNESVEKTETQHRVYQRQTFEVLSPGAISLTEGVSETISFAIKGQRAIGGSLFAMQDLLGTNGTVSLGGGNLAAYTVSGNSLTFSAAASGSGNLVIEDLFTCTGTTLIPLVVQAPPPETGPSMANFTKVRHYTRGFFTDVDETSWFGFDGQRVVADAYEYGLMQGKSAFGFDPSGNVTLAEAITMAARVHSRYQTGTDSFVQGSPWYGVYVTYAISNGIIQSSDFSDYGKLATRSELAYIFANALPVAEFAVQNTVNSLPDVTNGTSYAPYIFRLYRAGVLTGSDASGTFHPTRNISRAEAAALISRVALPVKRATGRVYG